jgi:hypothetical protein
MQESPGSDRETIVTYSLLSQTSVKTSEITRTAYSKQMHDQKTNIHEHINIIHRETTPAMKLNQRLSSINSKTSVHGCSSQILCLLSLLAPE